MTKRVFIFLNFNMFKLSSFPKYDKRTVRIGKIHGAFHHLFPRQGDLIVHYSVCKTDIAVKELRARKD